MAMAAMAAMDVIGLIFWRWAEQSGAMTNDGGGVKIPIRYILTHTYMFVLYCFVLFFHSLSLHVCMFRMYVSNHVYIYVYQVWCVYRWDVYVRLVSQDWLKVVIRDLHWPLFLITFNFPNLSEHYGLEIHSPAFFWMKVCHGQAWSQRQLAFENLRRQNGGIWYLGV